MAETPAELFKQGQAAYARGEYRQAAEAFERANQLSARAATLYNAGIAWQAAQDRPRAADDYQHALGMAGLEAAFEADARSRLEELERVLATVDASLPEPGKVSVAHVVQAPLPAHFHLEAGDYDAVCESEEGRSVTRAFHADAGGHLSLAFEFPPRPDVPVLAPPPEVRVVPLPPPPISRRTWGWVTLGVAGVAAGVGAVCGVEALSARDTFVASSQTNVGARDSAATLRASANVAWGAAAVAGAAAAWLLFKDAGPRPQASVTPGGAALSVSGAF